MTEHTDDDRKWVRKLFAPDRDEMRPFGGIRSELAKKYLTNPDENQDNE